MVKKNLVIGTRGSKLALWQAEHVARMIAGKYPNIQVELRHIVTTGDKILDVPLAKIGGKGLFTKELEHAMLNGEIDLAVHSMKDMPTELPEGLMLAAVTKRADPGDALVSPRYGKLDKLPPGARIGTSSLRRKAQLLHYRPDFCICDLRGNLNTRMSKLETGDLDAIVLAVSGLVRLGWEEKISQILPQHICLPAVGQGALAIETRSDDFTVREIVSFVNDPATATVVTAERSYLKKVEGGCQVPLGVYGTLTGDSLLLSAVILSTNGKQKIEDQISGPAAEAAALGVKLAERMLAAGGREILAAL
ncbi:hydroxymethylbilane synthase [Propionispora sp. 2/2-37]|uniref:hydroxymethylbilane synthase n=1 Tax=Propionispora sp. 2/2-37 TaxID=1677858 RepID=UPI0006BB6BC5|nr:hydroxymethylbilane synthase [Propionispora sp. 2/2-37]